MNKSANFLDSDTSILDTKLRIVHVSAILNPHSYIIITDCYFFFFFQNIVTKSLVYSQSRKILTVTRLICLQTE